MHRDDLQSNSHKPLILAFLILTKIRSLNWSRRSSRCSLCCCKKWCHLFLLSRWKRTVLCYWRSQKIAWLNLPICKKLLLEIGEKTAIHSFRNYLVIVSNDTSQNTRYFFHESFSFTWKKIVTNYFRAIRTKEVISEKSRSILSIFDLHNKFIAYTAPVRTIQAVFSEWGSLFTVSSDAKMAQLTEKDIQSKLELLFKKNFYDVAIK